MRARRQKLTEQWAVDERGVVGMIGTAKTSKNLYGDLRRLGFEDDEFPEWGHSHGRPDAEQTRPNVEHERPTSKDDELTVLKTNDAVVLRPHTPGTPVPREGGRGRPTLRGQNGSGQDGSPEDDDLRRQDEQDGFTRDEVDLLRLRAQPR